VLRGIRLGAGSPMILDDKPSDFPPEDFNVSVPPRAKRPGLAIRHVLFLGVAGACVFGAGLGLWARPAMSERQATAAVPADASKTPLAAVERKLEIVVDSRPAPVGAPIDVLPARQAPQPLLALPVPAPSPPLAPPRAQGLMKVQDAA